MTARRGSKPPEIDPERLYVAVSRVEFDLRFVGVHTYLSITENV